VATKPIALSDKIIKRMRRVRLTRKDPVGGQGGLALFRYEPVDGEPVFKDGKFKAGQYTYLATQIDGGWVNRLYSLASAPFQRDHLELFVVVVDEGQVTPVLFGHEVGEELLFMGPAGKFTLAKTDRMDLCFVATGTGLAPFVSMLRQLRHERRTGEDYKPHRVTLFQGVRYARDLGYHSLLREMQDDGEIDLVYIPTVSRPDQDEGFNPTLGAGRVNALVRKLFGAEAPGRIQPMLPAGLDAEAVLDRLQPERTAFFLCGNPGMIDDLQGLLGERGYDQLFTEDYW
jgi:ferredoxin--NADP+ reductase